MLRALLSWMDKCTASTARLLGLGTMWGSGLRNDGGCTHAPLLGMHNRLETVVLCILQIIMAVGKYFSVWIRKLSRLLKPA